MTIQKGTLTLKQFMLRGEVLKLYRNILRAIKKIPDDHYRQEMKDWAQCDFKKFKNLEEEVFHEQKDFRLIYFKRFGRKQNEKESDEEVELLFGKKVGYTNQNMLQRIYHDRMAQLKRKEEEEEAAKKVSATTKKKPTSTGSVMSSMMDPGYFEQSKGNESNSCNENKPNENNAGKEPHNSK